MSLILWLVFGIVVPLVALGCGGLATIQFVRGRKVWARRFMLSAGLLMLLSVFGSMVVSRYAEEQVFLEVCGLKFRPQNIYAYNSPRSQSGESYTFHVFQLADAELAQLTNATAMAQADLPALGENRKGWTRLAWQQGPWTNDEHHLQTQIFPKEQDMELGRMQDWLKTTFPKKDILFAGRFQEGTAKADEKAVPKNVDFFLIDPVEKRLVIINHSTSN